MDIKQELEARVAAWYPGMADAEQAEWVATQLYIARGETL